MIEEIPSQLESPAVPIRPKPRQKRRVSNSVFKQVIEKTTKPKSQVSVKELSTADSSIGDTSIPSTLDSPEVKPRRPMPKSKRVSGAAFKKIIEETAQTIKTNETIQASQEFSQASQVPQSQTADLSVGDVSIPSTLDSPEVKPRRPMPKSKRVSGSAFKKIIEETTQTMKTTEATQASRTTTQDLFQVSQVPDISYDMGSQEDYVIPSSLENRDVNRTENKQESIRTSIQKIEVDDGTKVIAAVELVASVHEIAEDRNLYAVADIGFDVDQLIAPDAMMIPVRESTISTSTLAVHIEQPVLMDNQSESGVPESEEYEGNDQMQKMLLQENVNVSTPIYVSTTASAASVESAHQEEVDIFEELVETAIARSTTHIESPARPMEEESSLFDIPSELDSVENVPNYRPGPASKKRESIAANFRAILSQRKLPEEVPEAPTVSEIPTVSEASRIPETELRPVPEVELQSVPETELQPVPETELQPVDPSTNSSTVRRSSTVRLSVANSNVALQGDYSAHISEDESGNF